jgi:hypothetical protein
MKKAGNKKVSVKKHKFTSSSTRGLVLRSIRKPIAKAKKVGKKKYKEQILSIFFEPIPKNFGYSLEGYSHQKRCRAPDRKKSTRKDGRK